MKSKRCKRLGSTASVHVSRTALVPSISYGSSCTSFPSGLLRDLRGVVAQLIGPTLGRSTTARLALRNCEPTVAIVLAPLKAWWAACWQQSLPFSIMGAALRGAAKAAVSAGHLQHSQVAGGAGAYLSSLERIGWHSTGIDSVITERGQELKLGGECDPIMLLRLASTALDRKMALESDLAASLTSIHTADGCHRATSIASNFAPIGDLPGLAEVAKSKWREQYQHNGDSLIPWLRPAIDAVKAAQRGGCSAASCGSFMAFVEGGWWTQAKLHYRGLATDPFCRWCGEEHGTLWHRIAGQCKGRSKEQPPIVQEGLDRWWDPLFSRGIPAMPLLPELPREQTWCFPENASQVLLTGVLYTDGAMRGLHPEARRGGWAFAMLASELAHGREGRA